MRRCGQFLLYLLAGVPADAALGRSASLNERVFDRAWQLTADR